MVGQLVRQLVCNVFRTRYDISFYFWWIEPTLKSWNLQFYLHDCLKLFLSSLQISCLKGKIYPKNSTSWSWKISHNTCCRAFAQYTHIIFAWTPWERLWRFKREKDIEVWRRLVQVVIFFLHRQSWPKSMKQCPEIKHIGQDEKALISVFASFFTAGTKVLFREGRLGTKDMLPPIFEIFLIFSDFLRS